MEHPVGSPEESLEFHRESARQDNVWRLTAIGGVCVGAVAVAGGICAVVKGDATGLVLAGFGGMVVVGSAHEAFQEDRMYVGSTARVEASRQEIVERAAKTQY